MAHFRGPTVSRSIGLLASLAASACPIAAQAEIAPTPTSFNEPLRLERGQIFAAFALGAGVQRLPRFNSTFTMFSPSVFLGAPPLSPSVTGVEPGGEIGFAFREGTFPAWAGNRVRVALFGAAYHAQGKTFGSARFEAGSTFVMYGVNGSRFTALTTTVGGEIVEELKVEREGYRIGLKLESDVALGSGLTVTPVVAVFGGHASDKYTLTGGIAFDSGGIAPTAMNERLRTDEVGGHLGARATWRFRPGWALLFGGTAGPVWLRARLTAENCFNTGATFANECGPSNPTFRTSQAADRASATGFRGTATLGLAATLAPAIVSLGGFMRYDSRIPGIENPQSQDPSFFGSLAPARIRYAGGFAYGGFVTLRIPLH